MFYQGMFLFHNAIHQTISSASLINVYVTFRDDINWLTELPYTISIPSRAMLVVHAGVIPYLPLHQQTRCNMVTIRNIITTNSNVDCAHRADTPIAGIDTSNSIIAANIAGLIGTAKNTDGEPWAKVWNDFATASVQAQADMIDSSDAHVINALPHVYFGHDAKRGLQLYEYATGLDTGCVYGECDSTTMVR